MSWLDLFRSRTGGKETEEEDELFSSDEDEAFRRQIDRQLVRLLPTAVCAEWVKRSYERSIGPPYPTLKRLRAEANAYLVPGGDGDKEEALGFVEEHFEFLFRCELVMHEPEEQHWPPLTLELFRRWFEVEVTEMVIDVADLG
jgi:hypothetical protein